MSGLAAIFHRDRRPATPEAVRAMLDAVPYRGPDGTGIHSLGSVALGHARLAITPEDVADHQPLVSLRSGCAIVADARLDNRPDLLAQLADPPLPRASDAELILRAYEAWGLDAPARLLGDFAFIIWDNRNQRLVCARDTSGQRSLFYRVNDRVFVAASEIHQLFQDPSVPIEPNPDRIFEYLVPFNMRRNEADQSATFYAGIYSVPAGHVLVIDSSSQRQWRYWELRINRELRYRTSDQYADHYRSLLEEVVGARLRSAYPVGALLSGGLDSSSVVCTAQRLRATGRVSAPGFTTFSLVYPDLECDEQPYIGEVQRMYDLDAHLIAFPRSEGWLQSAPDGFREAPNMGLRASRDAICADAASGGVRAILTGDIADSCVGGSPLIFDSLLRHRQLGAYLRLLRVYRRTSGQPLRTIFLEHTLAPLLPRPLQKLINEAYLRRRFARKANRLLPYWLREDVRQQLAKRHFEHALQAERQRRFSNPTRHWEYGLLYPPEVWRYAVPWSIEFWRPFADRRLHEFLLAIPPEEKFEVQSGTDEFYAASKQLVRRAMRGVIPDGVRTRWSRTDFGSEFADEVRRQWPRYASAFGPGARAEVVARGYVDEGSFWQRLQLLRDGRDANDTLYLIEVIALESWLRTFQLPRAALLRPPAPAMVQVAA